MKSETYFKVLFKWLSKSICFAWFSKEIRLIWLACQISLSLPWTLYRYQSNPAEDSQMYHIPTHFVPTWKQTEECPVQESLWWGSNKTTKGHGAAGHFVLKKLHFLQLFVGLLSTTQTGLDVWRGSGVFWLSSGNGQGTKVLSCYVPWLMSYIGAVLSPSQECILTHLGRLRSAFWKRFSFSKVSYRSLSRFFIWEGVWGTVIFLCQGKTLF